MKLTVSLRDHIADKIIAHRFDEEEATREARRVEIGQALYDVIYPPDVRAQMARLPSGFFRSCDELAFEYKDGSYRRHVNAPLGGPRLVACCHEYRVEGFDEHPLVLQLRALDQEEKSLDERRREARRQVKGVLNSVTTVKKLREIWPEIEAFIPSTTPRDQLPALVPAQLNQLLDLPPKVAEAA